MIVVRTWVSVDHFVALVTSMSARLSAVVEIGRSFVAGLAPLIVRWIDGFGLVVT